MINGKWAGVKLEEAKKAAILIHGRGAEAEGILSLKEHLNLDDFALFAPQAPNHSWYPYSFMAPEKNNEPALTHALSEIGQAATNFFSGGIRPENLWIIGFSQGACLALEYAAQNPQRYGAIIAFTGGLIGGDIRPEKYVGDFDLTPIFIGAGKNDPHVPLTRIMATSRLLETMGAEIKLLLFDDQEHIVRKEEMDWVNHHLLEGQVK